MGLGCFLRMQSIWWFRVLRFRALVEGLGFSCLGAVFAEEDQGNIFFDSPQVRQKQVPSANDTQRRDTAPPIERL